jgi:hypothetical protein
MSDRAYDRNRLKDLIHYVIGVAGARPHFGATKLYKVAWFSDARAFVLHGRSITGARYIREKHGPIPQEGMVVRQMLVDEGRISQWQDKAFDHMVWHFKAIQPPPANAFTPEEKQIVDWWIDHIDGDHTATSISDESHDYAWEIARMKEPLPFTASLAERIREPTPEEKKRHRTRAKELGLL